jgi:hypothetical protein
MLDEKRALQAKEQAVLRDLNAALNGMGYQVIPLGSANSSTSRRGPITRTAERSTTPRKRRGMSAAARKAVGRRMKAYWAKRRKEKAGAKSGK